MEIKHILDATYEQEVKDGLVLVDFWAPWCGPCKMIAPVLDEISRETDEVKIVKMNVDENSITPGELGIMSIPTLLLYKNGEIVDKHTGFAPKEALEALIDQHK